MFAHYGLWALALFGAQVFAATYSSDAFENSAIVRVVELGAALGHMRTTYSIKSLDGESTTYALAVGEKEHEKTSFIEVRVKGKQKPLQLPPVIYSPERSENISFSSDISDSRAAVKHISTRLHCQNLLPKIPLCSSKSKLC